MKTHEVVTGIISYRNQVNICAKFSPNEPARIATEMASRLALVAAIPDGEDSAGRQKLRLPTAEEAATRACDLAAALWDEFSRRDWLLELPTPNVEATEND